MTARHRSRAGERCVSLEIDGRAISLKLRRDRRARHLILRIDSECDGAVVTLPRHVPLREGLELAESKARWIISQLEALPPRVPFADGATVPFLGVDHLIRHDPGRGRPVGRAEGEIRISGRPEHLARRLKDWLREQARHQITPRVQAKAERLGRSFGGVTIRDTRSRWGSCSADGRLSFSWRLVMTPEEVLDYVVAHEVAHLAVRNHGPRFWRTVEALTDNAGEARAWLDVCGAGLHRFG